MARVQPTVIGVAQGVKAAHIDHGSFLSLTCWQSLREIRRRIRDGRAWFRPKRGPRFGRNPRQQAYLIPFTPLYGQTMRSPSNAVLAAALSLILCACSQLEPEPERARIPVVAQNVSFLPEQSEVEAIGSARASTSAEIFPETAGRVTEVLFSAGDYVRQGAPLLRLDDRQERLAVDAARVLVREADQLLSRYRRIEDTGALSESQIEAGETALASAQVGLEQAQIALADRTVRAPFSGHVGLTEIDRGDRVNDTTPIAQVDQRGTLYVDFPAPEAVFNALRAGQVVQVTPFSDASRTIDARVVTTDTRISQDSRDFIVRAAIPNSDDRPRPGMSFRVVFSQSGVTRAAFAEEAIVWGGEGSHMFVVVTEKPFGCRSRSPHAATAWFSSMASWNAATV